MRTLLRLVVLCLLVTAVFAAAQDKPAAAPNTANPYSSFTKNAYNHMKGWVISSAEKMPEESYAFKPTPEVRSFGQIIGHVADAQYLFCAPVTGEANPRLNIERTKTSKADLIAALKQAFAFCDKAYDSLTDANGTSVVTMKVFNQDMPKLNVLTANAMHMTEHYGNLITYLRMKNIVPPSTEEMQPRPKAQPSAEQKK